ncbi:MAG: indolepyruvate oxidoreductase subunit beta [Candidatus Ranarchaeia archaeon]
MSNNSSELNMIVAGVGGQGSILCSHIIADAAVKAGLRTRVGETFGASQRGGAVHSHVRIGKNVHGPLVQQNKLDVLVGLEPNEALRLASKYLSPEGVVIVNTEIQPSADVNIGAAKYTPVEQIIESLEKLGKKVISFNATKEAIDLGNSRVMNIILLGTLSALNVLPFSADVLKQAISERVPPKTIDLNLKAFELGKSKI